MKKWLIGIIILFIVGYGVTQMNSETDNEKLTEEENNDHVQDEDSQTNGLSIRITKDQVYKGDLLLINTDYPVPPEAEVPEAVNLSRHPELVDGFVLLDDSIRLSRDLTKKISMMMKDAQKDGVSNFIMNSGYRDEKEQNELYEKMGPDGAMPAGYSEHHLGLAVDIGSTQGKMEYAAEGKWMKDNAWKYGFILRYPEDKTAITGVQYEPWHFRYVGLPHSAIMYEKNFVLEEYLDYLKERKSVTTTFNNQVYEIYYYSVSESEDATIHVPANHRYERSGNNIDGVIVTVYSGEGEASTNEASTDDDSTNETPWNDPSENEVQANTIPPEERPAGTAPTDTIPAEKGPAGAVPTDMIPAAEAGS